MSSDIITREQIESLRAKLPLKAHSIRQGHSNNAKTKCVWFVYLDKIAIIDRLDEVFPGEWQYTMTTVEDRGTHYAAVGSLTIRGQTRSFNGTQSKGDRSPDNDEKGCGTDTFRRTASMWGIGSYLHDSPDIWTAKPAKNDWDATRRYETEAKQIFARWFGDEPEPPPPPQKKQSKKDGKPSNNKQAPATNQQHSDLHYKINNVFPDYHPITTLKAMNVTSLDDFGNLSNAAVQIKDHCYNSLFPVKCHYMRYFVTETQKYLEFTNDYDPKLQHGLIRAYGRSTNVKKKLDGIDPGLYAGIGCDSYDGTEITSMWKQIPQALVLSYNEGSGYYTMTDIQLPDEDVEM